MEYYTDMFAAIKYEVGCAKPALIRDVQLRGANARESRMLERHSPSRNEVVRDI